MPQNNPSLSKLLFLNFNGVLHPNGVVFFAGKPVFQAPYEQGFEICVWAPVLELILNKVDPDNQIQIVLTTAWAHQMGWQKAAEYLPESLKNRVIASTDGHLAQHSIMNGFRLIEAYLDQHNCSNWLAIDNDSFGWPEQLKNQLVLTEFAVGLSLPKTQDELKSKLVDMSLYKLE